MTDLSTTAEHFFERYAFPYWLREHSRLVGAIGHTLARARAAAGDAIDVDTVTLAAYLHDIGKSPLVAGDARQHNELSALILAAEGLAGAVEPARRHAIYAVLDPATAPTTLADKIVYVADRRGGLRVESVEERARGTAGRHPRYAVDIRRAVPIAKALEREVFAGLPFAPDQLEAHLVT
jgi:HD superfamily phosphodiesterase